jgi:hypothetical protein
MVNDDWLDIVDWGDFDPPKRKKGTSVTKHVHVTPAKVTGPSRRVVKGNIPPSMKHNNNGYYNEIMDILLDLLIEQDMPRQQLMKDLKRNQMSGTYTPSGTSTGGVVQYPIPQVTTTFSDTDNMYAPSPISNLPPPIRQVMTKEEVDRMNMPKWDPQKHIDDKMAEIGRKEYEDKLRKGLLDEDKQVFNDFRDERNTWIKRVFGKLNTD